MNYQLRIKKLLFVFCLLWAGLAIALVWRMLWQGEDLGQQVYLDAPTMALLDDLAARGVITPAGEGVRIDAEKFAVAVPSPGRSEYILSRQRFFSFSDDGSLLVDPAAFKITNRRLLRQSSGLDRGCILDRHGRMLAHSTRSGQGKMRREYPLGPAALPLLGVVHPVYGQKGLEMELASLLEGRRGAGFWSFPYRFLAGKEKKQDVFLTIDAALQDTAFKALANRTGAVLLLDVRNGEILAAASTPSFDPAQPPGPVWDAAAEQSYKGPFVNRAWERRYPPGSTFKLITATAWLETHGRGENLQYLCPGRHPQHGIRDYQGKKHGLLSLESALAESCNVYFAEIGVRLGPVLAEYAEKFGFHRPIQIGGQDGIPALGVQSLAFADRPGKETDPWQAIDYTRNPRLVAQGAVGQNVVSATVLQMAMVGAALANDGKLVAPKLVKDVRYADVGEATKEKGPGFSFGRPEVLGEVCRKQTARSVLKMMAQVVLRGTGKELPKIYEQDGRYHAGMHLPKGEVNQLAGKTGTAEAGNNKADHSWFVAVAPLDKPRYAVAVLVENGGLGAKVAGPIAVEVLLAALNREK